MGTEIVRHQGLGHSSSFPSKAGGVHAVDVSRSHDAWSSRQARCATAARGGTTTLWGRRPGSPIGRERPGP